MEAKFVQDGKNLEITAGSSSIAAGTIVISGSVIGITKHDIPANTPGAIATEGVFDIVKTSGVAFSFGDDVYWNTASSYACASAASDVTKIGTAVAAAGSSAAIVRTKIG